MAELDGPDEAAPPTEPAAGGAAAGAVRRTLWRHADYMKIWTAATVSLMGSQVSQLAIPIIAAVVLYSSPLEVALLGAVEMAPFILFALPAGAWLDRVRRRPVLIAGDVGRGLALLTIPIAFAAGVLTIWQLYAVGFITGSLTVLFDVADQSYLPALLDREELVEGNAKLSLPQSSAQVVGPALAGGLIGAVGAPFAIVFDAASFFASGGLISLIRKPEPRPERRVTETGAHTSAREDIAEGLRYVLGNRYLRTIAGSTATSNLGTSIAFSIFAIFAYRELGLSYQLVGTVFGLGGLGVLIGALVSERLSRRLGVGPAIVWSMFLSGPATFMYALMPSEVPIAAALLLGSVFLTGFTAVVYNVNQVSFRQAITPLDMQGRMNATMRFIVWGTMPLGSLIGGVLASFLPLRTTIAVGATVASAAFLWVLFSPVRSLREIPTQARDAHSNT
ncbi:MAG: MFS transporter [Candidatus Limnocylindrales bacterium]